jgi:acyl transferase domain-containing protein
MQFVGTSAHRDPVAIVGIGCRLPGVEGPREYWQVLAEGRDTTGPIPSDRLGGPGAGRDRIRTEVGGFLPDIDAFDADFFGLSAREALRLDPQHRLMVRTVWEAIEDAGVDARSLAGSRTSVYSACLSSEYWDVVRQAGMHDMHAMISNSSWGLAAGRISNLLDLRGPSLGLEATCSTSLAAVHLACRDLWQGDADQVLVTGANLLLSAEFYWALSDAEILTVTGRRRFGDAGSDGYIRSEGAVSMLLKPLSAALRDHDRVYATVLGTGVTNNGRGAGSMVAPGVDGQIAMLRRAYADAGVDPAGVHYVEAHGAGTPHGDEVELTALREVVGAGRAAGQPCLLGTAKSNIGHLEAAAGLAGLARTALALHHRTVPATLRVERPHPLLAGSGLALATETRPWPVTGGTPVAGVSSFGLSATNVHLVVGAAAPAPAPEPPPGPDRGTALVAVSARDRTALSALAGRYADELSGGRVAPADLAYTAAARRTHHRHRLAIAGHDAADLADRLRRFAAGDRTADVVSGTATDVRPRVVFVFPGQGSQWAGMGAALLAEDPAFRAALTECDAAVRAETGWSVLERITAGEELTRDDVIQPVLWAVQVALAAAWRRRGVVPDLVIGHSMGEVAAACVSGALGLRDGAAVICRRSRLIAERGHGGGMVAVEAGAAEAGAAIGELADRVAVGVVNSARACVLAGDDEALGRVVARLRAAGVRCRRVAVNYASHAPVVDGLLPELADRLADLSPRRAAVPMHSTVRDAPVRGDELDAGYWVRNLRSPVLFHDAVRRVLDDPRPVVFLEISGHPVLAPAVEDTLVGSGTPGSVVGSLIRGEPETATLNEATAALYVAGADPRWAALHPGGRFVDLPTYPWQNRRFWAEPQPSAPPPAEDVLSQDVAGPADAETVWNAALRAARGAAGGAAVRLSDVDTTALTGLPAAGVRTELRPAAGGGWHLVVRVCDERPDGLRSWRTVLTGRAVHDRSEPPAPAPVAEPGPDRDETARRLVAEVAQLLHIPPHGLARDVPLPALGVDSLLAVKLKNVLARRLGVDVTFRHVMTARSLNDLVATVTGLGAPAATAPGPS